MDPFPTPSEERGDSSSPPEDGFAGDGSEGVEQQVAVLPPVLVEDAQERGCEPPAEISWENQALGVEVGPYVFGGSDAEPDEERPAAYWCQRGDGDVLAFRIPQGWENLAECPDEILATDERVAVGGLLVFDSFGLLPENELFQYLDEPDVGPLNLQNWEEPNRDELFQLYLNDPDAYLNHPNARGLNLDGYEGPRWDDFLGPAIVSYDGRLGYGTAFYCQGGRWMVEKYYIWG